MRMHNATTGNPSPQSWRLHAPILSHVSPPPLLFSSHPKMFMHTVYSRRKATSFVGKTRKPGRNWREDDDDDDDGVGDVLKGNDNDEDFGIDSDIAGGLGRRLGLGLDGGTGGRQDWGRLTSDRTRREDSPPRHVAPPSSQRQYTSDLWERDSSD